MAQTVDRRRLELPPRTRARLEAFRGQVRVVKLAEGVLAAAFGLLLSYLLVFLFDRLGDTPGWLRALLLALAALGFFAGLPWMWYRWVWRMRGLEQVARLLKRTFPRFGERLLGIVELSSNAAEQERSWVLCQAAMRQVDDEQQLPDFQQAVPYPRHRAWAVVAGSAMIVSLLVLWAVPAAGRNALWRWLVPWGAVERYTFARLQPLPDALVIPTAEPFAWQAHLAPDTAWQPRRATARYGGQEPLQTGLADASYAFRLPPQKQPATLLLSVGDARKRIAITPQPRPELAQVTAIVELPAYLERSLPLTLDARGGALSVLAGGRLSLAAEATRELAAATLDGQPLAVEGRTMTAAPGEVTAARVCELRWRDRLGLTSREPFRLAIDLAEDQPPSIDCRGLGAEKVVLPTDVVAFDVVAVDDFGVRQVGLEWSGLPDLVFNPHPAQGEKLVAGGHPQAQSLPCQATFCAEREEVAPQSLKVRLYAVDYLPDRPRVYSATYTLHVLSPEDHALWLTSQLRNWLRQAEAVQQSEQELLATNQQLRGLAPAELDRPETRRRIQNQAAAERANGRRLGAVTEAGERLIQEAVRNDQFNVQTLENWAEMLQALKEIAAHRMPSVADLLQSAHDAPRGADSPSSATPADAQAVPRVGVDRDGRRLEVNTQDAPPAKQTPVPQIVDLESGHNEPVEPPEGDSADEEPAPGAARLTLPTTTVQGGGLPQERPPGNPAEEQMEQAVQAQEELLAQFAAVMDELQKILGDLEGSTFVKRLKAASRHQLAVANDVNESLASRFGVDAGALDEAAREASQAIAARETAHSDSVYLIQEDLQAYFHRVQEGKFRTVLDEMREARVVAQLRKLAGVAAENMSGHTMAQAEFWADALDRWAEQLVGPGCPSGGT